MKNLLYNFEQNKKKKKMKKMKKESDIDEIIEKKYAKKS